METLLYQTLSSDDLVRQHATKELKRHEQENYSRYAKSICKVLANEEIQDNVRMSAGLALKNSLLEKSTHYGGWLFSDPLVKNEIKSQFVSLLDTKKRNVANVISQVVAVIAGIELHLGQWHDLIDILVNHVTSHNASSNLKQATLQAIGYICESIDSQILSTFQCNLILTAIIEGARREQLDVNIRHAAIKALYNSLEFTKQNFQNTTERDYIMRVVCDAATQHVNSTIDLQVSAYECLNRIMQLYYDKMDNYMSSSLFNLTLIGMNRSDPKITLQAIEFWCTICDKEIKLKQDSSATSSPLYSFADQFVTYILPSIFTLIKKNSDEEYEQDIDDEWNISKAAANCLSLFASCSKELVVPQTIEFISENLLVSPADSLVWNQKEAAIIAFGSIIEGPCKHKTQPLVNQILPVLLSSMNNQNIYIRVAASWTLAQTIKQSIQVLDLDQVLGDIVYTVTEGLYAEQQKIVYNSCLSIIHLSEQLKVNINNNEDVDNNTTATTSPLSAYTGKILFALLEITQSTNTNYDTKCRNTIYEAMSAVVTNSAQDCIRVVANLTSSILDRLEKLNEMAKMGEQIDEDFTMLYTSLLGLLSNCIYRLKDESSHFSDRFMSLVYQITQFYLDNSKSNKPTATKNSTVVEDTFLLVSALINSIGKKFIRYIDHFLRDLSKVLKQQQQQQQQQQLPMPSLDNDKFCISSVDTLPMGATTAAANEENRLSLISVGIMSDISNTFGGLIFPYAGEFMRLLMNNLKSDSLHRDVKPATFSCIGDIAQALGPVFVPFVDTVMMAIKQAGNMQADNANQDEVNYVDAIRVGSLDAFIGMVQGLGQNAATREILLPFVTDVILFANSIAVDDSRSDRLTRTIFGLLGDVARIYGKRVNSSLVENLLNHLIIENLKGALHFSKGTKEMAHWAQQMVTTTYHK